MSATAWLDRPGSTDALADACESDAEILAGRIYEKRRLLKALRNHGRGKSATAKRLRAQIADLLDQQKQWAAGAKQLRADKPPVSSRPNRTRAARSVPPKPL